MFKNKGLLVKLAQAKDDEYIAERQLTHAERKVLIQKTADNAMVLIGFYMAADTLRKCIIHTVATKVT